MVSGVIALFNATCLDLVVASSNEKFQLLADIAKTYPAPSVDRRCVTVRVIQKPSGLAERALVHDWAGERLPRPHVWSPAATTWLVLLKQQRNDERRDNILLSVAPSLMQSPLDIAMPQQMRNALRTPTGKIGWEDLVTLARTPEGWARYGKTWGTFKLGKTNPTISTSGLNALISVNYAAQRTGEPDEFVKALEIKVVHYGDTVATFLSNLRAADDRDKALEYVSAIAIEEKQVYDYNIGISGCDPKCLLPPKEKLVALHPADGTLVADHPYAVLSWTDPARQQAASDFEQYLETPAIQRRFQAEGFRDHFGQPGDVLQPPYFERSGPKILLGPPDPPDLVEMLSHWSHVLRKPAHALFVVDVGLSMSEPISGTSGTKLDLAERAASDALEGDLTENDAVGLWSFPTTDGSPYRVAASPSTIATSTSALVRALPPVAKAGDERGFYGVVRASVEEVRASFARERINAVLVLTGGGYALTDRTASDGLVDYLLRQPDDQRVRVYIVAYGPTSNVVLRRIAESSGGAFYDATTEQLNISEQLRNAMSNF